MVARLSDAYIGLRGKSVSIDPAPKATGKVSYLDESLLMDNRKTFLSNSAWIVTLVSQIERFEPFMDLVDVVGGLLLRNDVLDDAIAIAGEV